MIWIAPSETDTANDLLGKRLWDATDRFDFVLANPPFNVNAVDKERLHQLAKVVNHRYGY